jgi:aryl-alcohol dehydrogenase-like predicted oxidoreductase
MTTTQAKLPSYRILGSSGLRVFPLSLGTMGFGEHSELYNKMGVHISFEEAEKILLKYISVGGNFIDTANFYQGGKKFFILHFLTTKRRFREIYRKNY